MKYGKSKILTATQCALSSSETMFNLFNFPLASRNLNYSSRYSQERRTISHSVDCKERGGRRGEKTHAVVENTPNSAWIYTQVTKRRRAVGSTVHRVA